MADDPVYISVSVRWGAKVLKNNVVVSVGPSDTFYGLLLQQLPEEYTISKGWSSKALIPPLPLAECRHALAERTTRPLPKTSTNESYDGPHHHHPPPLAR